MSALMRRAQAAACAARQQLTSLLQLQLQAPGLRQQCVAFSNEAKYEASAAARAKATRFAKERKTFEETLAEMRKQWAKDVRESAARKQLKQQAVRSKQDTGKKAVASRSAADRGQRVAAQEAMEATRREMQAVGKVQRLQRQQLREEVLDVAREERRGKLLATSRMWATAETLDARIEEALDHPAPLSAAAQSGAEARAEARAAASAEAAAPAAAEAAAPVAEPAGVVAEATTAAA